MLSTFLLVSFLKHGIKLMRRGIALPGRVLLMLWNRFWSRRPPRSGRPFDEQGSILDLPCAHTPTIICASQAPLSPRDPEITITVAPTVISPLVPERSTHADEIVPSVRTTTHQGENGDRPHIADLSGYLTVHTQRDGGSSPTLVHESAPATQGGPSSAAFPFASQPQHGSSMLFYASPVSSNQDLTASSSYWHGKQKSSRPASIMTSASTASRRSQYATYDGPPFPHIGSNIANPSSRLVAPPNGNHPGTPVVKYDYSHVYPISPKGIKRYGQGGVRTPSVSDSLHIIPRLQFKYAEHDPELPPGWTNPFHPEGAYYFLHKEKRIFTPMDIWDDDVGEDVMGFADHLRSEFEMLNTHEIALKPNEVDLVVEVDAIRDKGEVTLVGRYYFASSEHRCIFWLEDYDKPPFLDDCEGVHLLSHKGLAITAQYWFHLELFPNLYRLSADVITELKHMLSQARCDHVTSARSAAFYNAEIISQLSSIVGDLQVCENYKDMVNSVWIVGRVMHQFVRNQFIHFHGQKGGRLELSQSIHGEDPGQSKTMFLLSHIFFGAPLTHVQTLNKLYVDGIVSIYAWKKFMDHLKNELQDFNLLATVLLTTNVGFLAIQSVDTATNNTATNNTTTYNTRSVTQIISYLSIVASLGSIILGLVLVGHTHHRMRDTAETAAGFLGDMSHTKYGQVTLAFIYSLPYALLMWGMLFFLAAFSVECYKPPEILSRVLVGTASIFIWLLVIFCICALRSERNWRGMLFRIQEKISNLRSHLWQKMILTPKKSVDARPEGEGDEARDEEQGVVIPLERVQDSNYHIQIRAPTSDTFLMSEPHDLPQSSA